MWYPGPVINLQLMVVPNLLIRSTTKHILDQKEPNSRGSASGAGKASPMFQGEVQGILGQFVKGYYVIGALPLIEGQSALYCVQVLTRTPKAMSLLFGDSIGSDRGQYPW